MVSSTGSSTSAPVAQFGGIVSGIDTASLIKKIIDAQSAPITTIKSQIATRTSQAGAVKDLTSRLGTLLGALKNFSDPTYLQGRTSSVSAGGTTPAVSASVDSTAGVGSFKVAVDQLATASYDKSTAAIGTPIDGTVPLSQLKLGTAITAGTFSVNGQQITITDPTTQTLNSILGQVAGVAGVASAAVAGNSVQIAGSGADVALGAGGDTSNFLTALKLLASPSDTSHMRTSTGSLGVAQTGATLANAGLATAPTATGTMTINGVNISYNSSQDSLSTVLSKINNSTAGVIATYDSSTDKVTMVSKTTGSTMIALQDQPGGNLLAALGLNQSSETLGQNAKYEIDAGSGFVSYYSATNTVSNAQQGVTLNLLSKSSVATPDTVGVQQDVDGAVGRMKDLVAQLNSTLSFIQDKTAYNPPAAPGLAPVNGVLAGDTTVSQISDTIRSIITSPIDGVSTGKTSFADLGLSFGAVGAAVNTTNTLTLDETKFRAALQSDPAGVTNVFSAFSASASLNPAGTGGVQGLSGSPSALRKPGTYSIVTAVNGDGTANLTATFTPSDGSDASTTSLNNLAAGSSVSALIPGVTLQLKGALTAGTDTLAITTPTRGLEAKLEQYLDPLTRTNGILSQRQDIATSDIKDLNTQITDLNARIDSHRAQLVKRFTAMELAVQKLKSQQSVLTSMGLTGTTSFG